MPLTCLPQAGVKVYPEFSSGTKSRRKINPLTFLKSTSIYGLLVK